MHDIKLVILTWSLWRPKSRESKMATNKYTQFPILTHELVNYELYNLWSPKICS